MNLCFLFRLHKFNPKTNAISLLAEGFYLANGVQLSPNEDFVSVSESARCRMKSMVSKYLNITHSVDEPMSGACGIYSFIVSGSPRSGLTILGAKDT